MINRFLTLVLVAIFAPASFADQNISDKIDHDTWQVISQSVIDRDIVAMGSTYHPDAVVVNAEKTSPISSTLIRWGEGMQKEIENGTSATVAFRFSERMDNEDSALETGIFNYISTDAAGLETSIYINFQTLLVKKNDRWLFVMEHQLDDTDKAAWEALQ